MRAPKNPRRGEKKIAEAYQSRPTENATRARLTAEAGRLISPHSTIPLEKWMRKFRHGLLSSRGRERAVLGLPTPSQQTVAWGKEEKTYHDSDTIGERPMAGVAASWALRPKIRAMPARLGREPEVNERVSQQELVSNRVRVARQVESDAPRRNARTYGKDAAHDARRKHSARWVPQTETGPSGPGTGEMQDEGTTLALSCPVLSR